MSDKQCDWDYYFLEMLELVKSRSPDSETRVACILTENNRIISTGFNGFPSGLDNLPTKRPLKYTWMLHSEQNAICNLLIKPNNPTAYITHYPCNVCLKMLWQIGCRRIVVPENRKFFSFSKEDQEVLDLLRDNGLELINLKDKNSLSLDEIRERDWKNTIENKLRDAGKEYVETKFVRVGQGISKVGLEHFGDFE